MSAIAQPIFYAWQSESDPKLNRYFIEDCLKKAIKILNRDEVTEYMIDRATDNVPGVPDIGASIYEKIQKSSLVVADLTIVNPIGVRRNTERPVPNANALAEFMYAIGRLGESRIIAIVNTAFGAADELPFDIRQKRLMTYELSSDDDKADVRKILVDGLVDAIKLCLGESQEEIDKLNSRIVHVLQQIIALGSEIEEWNGLEKPLCETVNKLSLMAETVAIPKDWRDEATGLMRSIAREIRSAAIVTFSSENWNKIKMHITKAGSTSWFLYENIGFQIDQEYHDRTVNWALAIPMELESHIESLYEGNLRGRELDELSYEFRLHSFLPLIPQHPRFTVALKEISMELRRLVLRWSKEKPRNVDMIGNLQQVRNQLLELFDKYDVDDFKI